MLISTRMCFTSLHLEVEWDESYVFVYILAMRFNLKQNVGGKV